LKKELIKKIMARITNEQKIKNLQAVIDSPDTSEAVKNKAKMEIEKLKSPAGKSKNKKETKPNETKMANTDELMDKLKKKKATRKTKSKTVIKKESKDPRVFIFKKETTSQRRSGGQNISFEIYEIKNNIPDYIGEEKANSASYKGDSSTVMNYLAEKGIISSEYNGYYRASEMEDKFKIIEI
jgi:hypothetical protein